jgi:LemA protein
MSATPEQSFVQAIDLTGRLIRASNFVLDHWWMWLLAGIALWAVLKVRSQHAMIAQLDERADAAFGDVDALLIERHTLIGNLAEVVRSFAAKERAVIRDVLDARVDALEAIGSKPMQSETQIATVLQNLFSVSENYPALASASHYSNLRNDLIRIEDRITAARRFYNLAVEELNAVSRSFPNNLMLLMLGRGGAPVREKFNLGDRRTEFAEPVKISL